MDKKDFIDKLNKVTLESNIPAFFHKTKIQNLKNILADGALLPLKSRKEYNYNYGHNLSKSNSKSLKSHYEKYLELVFIGFKPSSYKMRHTKIFKSIEDQGNALFIFNPYNLNEEILQSSFLCDGWYAGKFRSKYCKKWNMEKDMEINIEKWEKFLIKNFNNENLIINEIVIENSKGVNFNDILRVNPKGVMIVVDMEKVSDEVKNLVEQYPEYQWVFIK